MIQSLDDLLTYIFVSSTS